LLVTLRDRMTDAAASEQYEEAAQMRDALRTVQALRDRQQKVATPGFGNRDVFGLKVGPSGSVIQIFAMRSGRVVERVELVADPGGVANTDADVLQAALQQFYEDRVPPSEISLPLEIEDTEAVEAWLSARAERRVRISVPRRGDKRALVELATRNAALTYRTRFNEITAAHFDALESLRASIGLPVVPRRIECVDISTLQGSETVASMVVCEDGRMKNREYRKYRVEGTVVPGQELPAKPDDFAAMREVVQRRYQKVINDGGPFPDLILVDGGRGQLSAAYDALELIGLSHLVVVGIAKREELLFTRDGPEPTVLPTDDPGLLLLQRIRDEAHRFAVTFHRKARTMRDFQSALDGVSGIGPRRRRALLTAFGSLAGVRRATREELGAVVGAKTASAVLDYFNRQ
jgi:excinuclease ABC subunit C